MYTRSRTDKPNMSPVTTHRIASPEKYPISSPMITATLIIAVPTPPKTNDFLEASQAIIKPDKIVNGKLAKIQRNANSSSDPNGANPGANRSIT